MASKKKKKNSDAASKSAVSFWEANKINIIGWGVIVVLLVAFFAFVSYTNQQTAEKLSQITTVREDDNMKGDENGEVVVIEYADFACPGCASFSELGKQLVNDESVAGGVKFIFRNLPILGNYSVEAAVAAEAAADQGKFWQMHDQLYSNQTVWRLAETEEELHELFTEYAEEIDLDVEKFVADLDSEELLDRVRAEQSEAFAVNLRSTPSIFINGEKLDVEDLDNGYESLLEVVSQATL